MKLGACTSVDNWGLLNELGYDYIELALNSIAEMGEEQYKALLKTVEEQNIKIYSFNCFLPGSIRLVGEDVNYQVINKYLEAAIKRASELGAEIIVFGSGGSRRVPEGFDKPAAYKQLNEFLLLAGEKAEAYNVTITIEPLRKGETNIINTAEEGLYLVKEVNHPNIKLLVDYYHMYMEGENANIILKAGSDYIKHIHLAEPKMRVWPRNKAEADYEGFVNMLKTIGYDKGISIEAGTEDIKGDAVYSLDLLKSLTTK